MASPNNAAEHKRLLHAVAFAKEKLRTCLKDHGPWIHGNAELETLDQTSFQFILLTLVVPVDPEIPFFLSQARQTFPHQD
jgi:hypothetical protein